ncbi:MAG: CDGSH iron-sulfur domain-containing protein [Burkholderiales bacterium]|nr:MAG: CDGSH iron-sulfur domain-containing protein [Burkholderiales bacterium]
MTEHIVVQDREELIYLLCEAAEFEHTVMCSYLYAQWTLKRETAEGVTAEELAAIERWRRSLAQVALEEMLHLSLVNNLLAAIGAAPHLWRPAFPVRPGHFPADVVMDLSPFGEAALDHFMFIERPENIRIADGAGFEHASHYRRLARPDMLAPSPQDYGTQGHLYHGALQGLLRLAEQLGEERVFVGHGQAQVGTEEFGLPGLFRITDLASAKRAVEQIVLQGEGAPAHREDSHFARFSAIRRELAELRAARPGFEPARPVVRNPLLGGALFHDGVPIVEPLATKVVDLANSIYALMIRVLSQVFAPAPLPQPLRVALATSSSMLMSVMGRVAEVATRLPADPARPGLTAAPNFELPGSSGQLVQQCAARILGERSAELGRAARQLAGTVPLAGVADDLDALALRFEDLHQRFETPLGAAVERVARVDSSPAAAGPPPAEPSAGPPRPPAAPYAPEAVSTPAITIRFDGHRCIHARHCVLDAPTAFIANSTRGSWLHPETVSVEQCVRVAHNCPSGAISYERHDGGPQETAPAVNVLRVRENGPYAVHAQIESPDGGAFRATLCRCGKSKRKPYCDGRSHATSGFAASGEPATLRTEPLAERAGPLRIDPQPNGPLQLSGNVEILAGTGRVVLRTQSARLCRCGASGNKPFCDGSHARVGFRSDE